MRNSRICVLKEHWETTSIFVSVINETSLADFHDKLPWSFYALSFIMTSLSSSEYFSYNIAMQPSCHIVFELLKTTPISNTWDKPRCFFMTNFADSFMLRVSIWHQLMRIQPSNDTVDTLLLLETFGCWFIVQCKIDID